uniref:Uncharacterized protein n=1 Tax=Rhodococcoides fascians D188 TaxID=1051973 RepID=G8JZ32_RHOFA|nr:hypothetical protein pFi_167 [Rhodococcus fascians D188]
MDRADVATPRPGQVVVVLLSEIGTDQISYDQASADIAGSDSGSPASEDAEQVHGRCEFVTPIVAAGRRVGSMCRFPPAGCAPPRGADRLRCGFQQIGLDVEGARQVEHLPPPQSENHLENVVRQLMVRNGWSEAVGGVRSSSKVPLRQAVLHPAMDFAGDGAVRLTVRAAAGTAGSSCVR